MVPERLLPFGNPSVTASRATSLYTREAGVSIQNLSLPARFMPRLFSCGAEAAASSCSIAKLVRFLKIGIDIRRKNHLC